MPLSVPSSARASRSTDSSSSGSATAGAGPWRGTLSRSTSRPYAGSCPGAGRSSGPRGPTRCALTPAVPVCPEWSGSRTTWLAWAWTPWSRSVATKLYGEGVNVVGVPKTIDNDLGGTDYTFGFDTAVNIAMEAIDRLHTTAESHHRALIVEV